MKHSILITFLTTTLFVGFSNGQTNQSRIASIQQNTTMNNFEYTFKTAHPKAQVLMQADFYWSPIEETAPFGSDDGSDAAYGFRQWIQLNPKASPVIYLKELIASW